MAERQAFDAGDFAEDLETMTDDELFALMQTLELESEDVAVEARETSDVFARIALVETAIEDRFPVSCWHLTRNGSNGEPRFERGGP